MIRRYLDRLDVCYVYRDMECDPAAARQVRWWTAGSFSHPTVQVGSEVLVEPSLDEVDRALSRVGIV
jgi:mycoredoxin